MINNYTKKLSTGLTGGLKTQVLNDVGESPTIFGKKAKWLNSMLLALFILVGGNVLAQTGANYAFSTSSGSFSTISATGTPVAVNVDDTGVNITGLAPGFTVNGVTYTNVRMGSNGWLMLYTTTAPTATTSYTPLSSANTNAAVTIAPFGRDLNGSGGSAWRQTIGVEQVFEWSNFTRFAGSDVLNFQVRLNTSTGAIVFVYGNCTPGAGSASAAPQVGWKTNGTVAANWATDINNLYLNITGSPTTCNWSNAVTGNANSSTMNFAGTSASVVPASGLTYTWTPQSLPAPVRLFSAVTAINSSGATVSWTAPTGATSYNVQYKSPTSCTWTNWSGNPVATNSVTLTGLTPVTAYQVRVQASNGTTQSIYSHAPNAAGTGDGNTAAGSFTTAANICIGTPAAANITGTSALCANTGTTLSLSTAYTLSGISYQWQSSLTAGGPYTNLGTAATQATGNLTATTYYICTISCAGGSSFTTPEHLVTVNALPLVTVSSSSSFYCNPGGTAVSLTAGGALTYTWSPAAGLSGTTGQIVTATPTSTTAYTVTGTDGNACQNTASTTVTVFGVPQGVSATATPATICPGGTTTLNAFASIPSTVNNYAFAASTGAALDPMVGATTVLNTGNDDTPSGLLALPFAFNFNGSNYTTYSISPDGWILFGAAGGNQFINQVTSTTNIPKLYPYWDDLATGTTGNVSVLTLGSAPNRIFVAQWFITSPRATGGPANSTFQAWMYEGSNKVEFRYGIMGASGSASAGLTGSSSQYQSITLSTGTVSTSVPNDANNFAPATGTSYVFTPPTATFTWAPAGDVVSPNSQTTATNALSATQTFTVIASNNACSAAPASATVTITPLLCSAATYTSPNCAGSNFTVTANISGGGAPYSYAWSDGAGGVYPNAATITANLPAGTYNFVCTVTDSCGATCASSVSVTVNGLPTVTVAPTSALYCNPSTPIALTASGAATYAWSPATGLSAITGSVVNASPSSTTTYSVVGADANGCVAPSVSSAITVQPGPTPISVSSIPATVCNGTTVTLNATGGNISVTAALSFGTNLSSNGTLLLSVPLDITGIPSGAVISSAQLVLDNVSAINGSFLSEIRVGLSGAHVLDPAESISTLTGGTLASASISLPGFTATSGIVNLLLSESFNDGGDAIDATFGEVRLVISYSVPATLTWSSNPVTTLYTDAAATSVYTTGNFTTLYAKPTAQTQFSVAASLGSCTSSGSTTVAVNQLPVFSVAPITICNGTAGILSASSLESNSYAWTPTGTVLSVNSIMVSPSETTTYNVTATSNTTVPPCSSAQQVTVTVNEPGTIESATVSRTVSPGQVTTFEVVTTGLVTYQWQVNNNVSGWQNIVASNPDYSGETTAILSVQNITLGFDTYQYRCLVTGLAPCATLTPIEAILNVTNTGFSTQPANVNLCGTSSTSFSIVTTGDEPYNVQWQMSTDDGATFNDIFDGLDASGLTFSGVNEFSPKTLFVSGITTVHTGYQFKCQLDFFLDSGIATLTVNTPVTLTNNFSTTPVVRCNAPSAVATTFGISTTGSVTAVEWKYGTSASGPWNTIAAGTPVGASYLGANSNTLSVTTNGSTPVGNYFYKAFVTGSGSGANKCADLESAVATVSVVNPIITVSSSAAAYCTPGPAITLTASGSDINSYSWSTAQTGTSIAVTPSAATTYTVTGTDSNGCTNTAQVAVNVGGSFSLAATSSAATVCPGNPVSLNAVPTPLSGTSYLINAIPYQFNASSGSFTPLAGTVATAISGTADDTNSVSQPIGFSFNFGGTNYTNFRVNSNGLFSFGIGNTSAANSLTSTTSGVRPGIAPLWDDLQCSSLGVRYQVSGTAPNRVLTVEWLDMEWNWLTTPGVISFQVKLYEGTNAVALVYRNDAQAGNPAGSGGASVGLMGTAGSNFISLQNLSAAPTISTTSSTDNIATKPATGQTYLFTPVAPVTYTYAWSSAPAGFTASTAATTATPAANTTYNVLATSNAGCTASASVAVSLDAAPPIITTQPLTQQLCQGTTATLSVVASSATALSYQWFKDGTPITGNASASTANLTLTGTTPASSGSYTVTVTNCSTVTSEAAILTVYPTPTAVAPIAQAFCIDAVVPATPLTGTPSGVTFNISGGAALGLPNQTGVTSIPSFSPTASGSATISITPIANGCPGAAVTYSLTINPLPTAPVLTSNSAVCEGSSLDFTSTVAVQQGYTLNSNSGIAFIDISASGTSAGTISDDSEHPLTIPAFSYNGTTYTTALVGNNGALTFGITTGNIGFTNTALPGSTANLGGTAATICALWDDLTPGAGGSIRTQTVGNKYIVQWTQEDNFGATGTGTVTFQIQLDLTTSQIHLVYPDILYGVLGFDNAQTATIGLNYSATSALQYSFNTASILNGQSLTFTPAAYSYAWSGPNSFTSTLANPSVANATPAASGNYTLEITNGNGCKSSASISATVHPTPTAVAPADQLYYNGLATAAIPLSGTPSGVTFDISGGASVGLANATGLTSIPSFIPNTGSATVSITPKANNCTGATVTYNIVVSAVNANPIANQEYCEGVTTAAIPLSHTPVSLTGVTYTILGGASVGLADVTGVTSIPSFTAIPGTATITVIPQYGGVSGGAVSGTILVNPLPTATIAGTTAVCRNDVAPLVTFTGANGTAPYTFTYKLNGGSNQTIVSSGNTATIAQATGTAGTFTYTLVSVQDSSSTTCSNAQTGTVTIIVHPTPTVAAVANQSYYSGFATAAIPLTGTPSGVTFNISGGAASGLADVNGVTAIPSFIPTTTPSTVTITPVANGCVGVPVTYQIALNPVVVNITSNACGGINHGLNNQIQAGSVSVPGFTTTGYQFEVTNTATGEVSIVFSSQSHFKLTDTNNYAYGTTFTIRVAAVLNGQVQGYFGNTCSLTTASVQTSRVVTAQCGSTLVFINSTINANSVGSTNLYRFRVALASAPTLTYLVERTVPNFKLTDVVGLPLLYNTEYLVDVQIRVKLAGFEAWSQYGVRCSVFTPMAPETSLVASQCEDYLVPSTTSPINAIAFPGATAYRFRLTGYDEFGDVNYQQAVTNASPSFTLSQFSGLTPGVAYTVAVAMELFGTFTDYAKDCSIITPSITKQVAVEPFKATAYPNPFAANFMIDVKTTSTSVIAIKVYDMVGRLVEQKTATVTDLETSPIGNNYPSGVYNVVVTQDETVQTVRVVKR